MTISLKYKVAVQNFNNQNMRQQDYNFIDPQTGSMKLINKISDG